ncbi:MAG: amino acid permease [Candidatus Woesearchaeota archaeon]
MAGLKKVLSYRTVLLITINSIMGTGIFFLPALGAGKGGPASLISWGIMGIISIYIAMCFAELTSMYPSAGGVYEFCKHAYGRFASFLIGWVTLVAGNVTIAMLVVGAVRYLLPYDIPQISIPISLLFIFIFNAIAYRGMKTSAVMLVAFSFITIGTLLALIIPGLFHINHGNISPFFVFPMSAIFVTIFFIAETFFGWETATFLAEETKDGQRVMPKALIIATVIITIVALLFVFISVGAINWNVLSKAAAPLSELSKVFYGDKASSWFTILVYLAIIGSVAGWIVSAPRLILAMARDNLFLKQLATIHPKYNSPSKAIIFQTIVTSILVYAGSGNYETLLLILVPMALILYSTVLISLVVLRKKEPKLKRYYKVPFGRVGPIIVALILISLVVYWVIETAGAMKLIIFGISLISVGIPLYLLLEMYYSPESIRRAKNIFARPESIFSKISVPKKIIQHIFEYIGNIEGKRVFEYGCSTGTLTHHLAKAVGKKGKVIATDISEKQIKIAHKKMKKEGHNHVLTIFDPKHMERVNPAVPKIHVIVSIGALSYVKNINKVLREMNKLLKKDSKIFFIEYDQFYDIIPNKDFLKNDKKITDVFKKAGFKVNVEKKQGFAWKYIYIYGIKEKNVRRK